MGHSPSFVPSALLVLPAREKNGQIVFCRKRFQVSRKQKNRTEKTATLRKNGQRKGKKVLIRAEAQVSATTELSTKDAFFFGHFGDFQAAYGPIFQPSCSKRHLQ